MPILCLITHSVNGSAADDSGDSGAFTQHATAHAFRKTGRNAPEWGLNLRHIAGNEPEES